MRSLRFDGDGSVSIAEAPRPEPGPGEVLVRTAASALCGSEMHSYRGGGNPGGNSGHEAAGTVEKVGDGVEAPRAGERVGVSAVVGCGSCPRCEQGQYTWCPDFTGRADMHAEAFLVMSHACHVLPDDVPWDVGVLITGDGFGVPYHTSTKLRDPAMHSVAIFGSGPIGLGSTIMQTHLGREVIAVDVSEKRLEYALALGARHVIDAQRVEDVVEAVKGLTGGQGADVCIEAAGRPETARQCFGAVATAGIVVFNGEQPAVELSPSEDFIRRDVWAVGSWYYHFSEYPEMLALYRAGVPIDQLVTHHLPFEQADEAYRLMAEGLSGKVVLEY